SSSALPNDAIGRSRPEACCGTQEQSISVGFWENRSRAKRWPSSSVTVAGEPDEDADPHRNRERHQRAMLDFLRQPAQRVVAELRRFLGSPPADFQGLIAGRRRAPAQPIGNVAEGCRDRLADLVGGLRRAGGGAAARTFQPAFNRSQAVLDLAEVGGNGAGISGLTEHDGPRRCLFRERIAVGNASAPRLYAA